MSFNKYEDIQSAVGEYYTRCGIAPTNIIVTPLVYTALCRTNARYVIPQEEVNNQLRIKFSTAFGLIDVIVGDISEKCGFVLSQCENYDTYLVEEVLFKRYS